MEGRKRCYSFTTHGPLGQQSPPVARRTNDQTIPHPPPIVVVRCTRLTEVLGDRGEGFNLEVASRLYDMCLLDYARVVLSSFWKGITPEKFAANKDAQNKAMVYRDVKSALFFLRRLDKAAARFEVEQQGHEHEKKRRKADH